MTRHSSPEEVEEMVQALVVNNAQNPTLLINLAAVIEKRREMAEWRGVTQRITDEMQAYLARCPVDFTDSKMLNAIAWAAISKTSDWRVIAKLIADIGTFNGHNRRVIESIDRLPVKDRIDKIRDELVAMDLVEVSDGKFEVKEPGKAAAKSASKAMRDAFSQDGG